MSKAIDPDPAKVLHAEMMSRVDAWPWLLHMVGVIALHSEP